MPHDPFADSSRWLGAIDFTDELAAREKAHQEQLAVHFEALLDVVDGFDRLLGAVGPPGDLPANVPIKSVRILARQLIGCLEQQGVSLIPCLGEAADPEIHEITEVREAEDVEGDVIVEVTRQGYEWNGQLFRRPRVVVTGHPKEEQP